MARSRHEAAIVELDDDGVICHLRALDDAATVSDERSTTTALGSHRR